MRRCQNASCWPSGIAPTPVGSVGPEDADRVLSLAEQDPRRSARGPSNADGHLRPRRLSGKSAPAVGGNRLTGTVWSRLTVAGVHPASSGFAFSPLAERAPGAEAGRSIFRSAANSGKLVLQSGQICLLILFTTRQQAGHLEHLLAQARIRNGKVCCNEIARLSARHQVCDMPLSFARQQRHLPRRNHLQTPGIVVEIGKKPCDRYPQLLSDLVQAGGADTGLASFVFLHLLRAASEPLCQVFLAQTQQDPPQSHPSADVLIDQVRLLGENPIRHFLPWLWRELELRTSIRCLIQRAARGCREFRPWAGLLGHVARDWESGLSKQYIN